MGKVKIVTDNTTDLPEKIIREYGIEVVPLSVHFGHDTYLPGVDLTGKEFYELFKKSEELPKTSQVSMGKFLKIYQELAGEVNQIISIHLSARLSGTFHSATNAADHVEGVKVYPVDSESVSMGMGFQIMAAVKVLDNGGSVEEALQAIERVKENLEIYFYVETLEYLEKGGRIGKAKSLLGSLLNIKPILQLKEGEIQPFEKVRSFKKGFKRLYDLVREYLGDSDPGQIQLAIMHIENQENAIKLKEKILKDLGIDEIYVRELGPIVGTHIGPGVLGIVLNRIEEN